MALFIALADKLGCGTNSVAMKLSNFASHILPWGQYRWGFVLLLEVALDGQLDHFVDVNKMIGNGVARDFAGGFRLGNGSLVEIPPFGVAKQLLEIAGEPIFHTAFGLLRGEG